MVSAPSGYRGGQAWYGARMQRLKRLLLTAVLLAACGDDAGDGGDAGEPPDFFACELNSDCVVVPESCCGRCGAPTRGDAVAIRASATSAYSGQVCGDEGDCPACAPLFIDPTLLATCSAGRCELVDLQEHEASACTQDADCRIRTPDCCECGGETGPGRLIGVAASAESLYADLVCDGQPCPECAPVYPEEVTVACSGEEHCETSDDRLP
jgi:hypothetical protein